MIIMIDDARKNYSNTQSSMCISPFSGAWALAPRVTTLFRAIIFNFSSKAKKDLKYFYLIKKLKKKSFNSTIAKPYIYIIYLLY
jgi:hypothetical protein